MNIDKCKLLYPSRIYCFLEHQPYTKKKYFIAMATLLWAKKGKLDAKYFTIVCKMKSLTCSFLPPLN